MFSTTRPFCVLKEEIFRLTEVLCRRRYFSTLFKALPDYNLRSTTFAEHNLDYIYELDMPGGEGGLHPHFPGGAIAGHGR